MRSRAAAVGETRALEIRKGKKSKHCDKRQHLAIRRCDLTLPRPRGSFYVWTSARAADERTRCAGETRNSANNTASHGLIERVRICRERTLRSPRKCVS